MCHFEKFAKALWPYFSVGDISKCFHFKVIKTGILRIHKPYGNFMLKSTFFWNLIFGHKMSISDKLLISILKWAVRRYQNQTSKLWFTTMTSSICVPTNTVKNRIWHITFYASLEFTFAWQINQPEVKFKVTFGCKCTESYGRSGNFHEVWKYYLTHNFWRFDEKHQTWSSDDLLRWEWRHLWFFVPVGLSTRKKIRHEKIFR